MNFISKKYSQKEFLEFIKSKITSFEKINVALFFISMKK